MFAVRGVRLQLTVWLRDGQSFYTSVFNVSIHRNLNSRFIFYIDSHSENLDVLKNHRKNIEVYVDFTLKAVFFNVW